MIQPNPFAEPIATWTPEMVAEYNAAALEQYAGYLTAQVTEHEQDAKPQEQQA